MVKRSKPDYIIGSHEDPDFIRALEVQLRDPPNLGMLPDDMRAKWEEEKYRRALKWKWGRMQGDPLLKSMKPDGTKKEGYFGPAVDVKEDEEV